MAIEFTYFSPTAVADIAAEIKRVVDSLSIYDEVTIGEDSTTGDTVVTIAKDDTTQLTITMSQDGIDKTFTYRDGNTVGTVYDPQTQSNSYRIWIGKSGKTVIISFQVPTVIVSTVLTRSEEGVNIIAHTEYDIHRETITMSTLSDDSSTTYQDTITQVANSDWASLIGVAAKSQSKSVVRSRNVYRMFNRPTGIEGIYSEDAYYKKFTLDEDEYLTDGYFCIRDNLYGG